MTTRRGFLAGVTAMTAAALPRLGWADAGDPAFLAAAKDGGGAHVLCGLDAAGAELFRLPLPARGHAAAAHPLRPEAVAFARRPGSYALVIDCARGALLARLSPPEGRQFNGHGAFSADGAVLYTSEVVAEGSAGRLGLWDTEGWRRIGEVATGGLGPHDVKRRAEGGLVVANGGIETDPDDRRKLNLATMAPNLAYLSAQGEIEEIVDLPADLHQASIRHLALAADGTVAFAMQWEGDPSEPVPLLGLHRRGAAPVLAAGFDTAFFRMRGYAGSIALDPVTGTLALTSPPGGVVQLCGADAAPLATLTRSDASGVAAGARGAGGFLVTDGHGGISRVEAGLIKPVARRDLAWDNHLIAV